MSSGIAIVTQLLVLLVLAAGGGCWLWLLVGRPPLWRGHTWLWLALAGFGLTALVLQSLVYCGVPLAISAWPVLALAAAGGALAVWKQRGRPLPVAGQSYRELRLYGLVALLALAAQVPTLLVVGTDRFYGTAKNDHATYVLLAEFLAQAKFQTQVEEVGYRPWMERALEVKEQRITQSIVLGSVAVITRASAQEAYGGVSIFLIAAAAVCVAAWLRVEGAVRFVATCAGLATALSPAVTRIHLDTYFSQLASLFVYPALAAMLGARGPLRPEVKVAGAILLAYMVGVYPEVAVFNFALMALLVWRRTTGWRAGVRDVLLLGGGALVLNPGYSLRLVENVLAQWRIGSNPNSMAAVFPDSGTFVGWGRLFFDFPWTPLTAAGGIVIGVLVAGGAVSQARRRRPTVAIAAIVAATPLLALVLLRNSPGYVFAKLCIQFVPVWLVGGVLGTKLLADAAHVREAGLRGLMILMVVLAGWGALPQHLAVVRPTGLTAELSSPGLRAVRREAEAHPGRAYLVQSDEPLLAQWLCYFGRQSDVVVDRRTVGDQILTTEGHAARRWRQAGELLWLDPVRRGPVTDYEAPPEVALRGAVETAGAPARQLYVAGESIDFVFTRPAAAVRPRAIWLDFVVVPWRQDEPCRLELVTSAGRTLALEVTRATWCRWPLELAPGTSVQHLRLFSQNTADREPRAVIKLVSVEVSPVLPPWQHIPEAAVVAGGAGDGR